MLEVPESSYYYSVKHPSLDLTQQKRYQGLRQRIEKIIKAHPSYGYRRIREQLTKEKVQINHKPLKKLLKAWHLQRLRRIKTPKPSPLAQHIKNLGGKANLVAQLTKIQPLQVVFTDFTQISCQFTILHLILFSDKISRRITGWSVGLQEDTANALKGYVLTKRYLKRMNIDLTKVIIHQDQDSVFTGYEYAGTLLNDGIALSFTQRGFKDNPAMESCIGHFKEEYADIIQEAKSLGEAKKIIKRCVKDWNKKRIHSALKGRSPDEFIHTFCKLKKS